MLVRADPAIGDLDPAPPANSFASAEIVDVHSRALGRLHESRAPLDFNLFSLWQERDFEHAFNGSNSRKSRASEFILASSRPHI